MNRTRAWQTAVIATLAVAGSAMSATGQNAAVQPYESRREGDIVRLVDRTHDVTVGVVTSIGHMAYDMTVKGQPILRFPFASLDAFRATTAGMHGIPLLAPWGNRLDEQAFYANGVRYPFDMSLGNVSGAIPSHGFLSRTDRWEVLEVRADAEAAWITSRLEVFRVPAAMKQWPFAHTIEMTYRLSGGELEVRTLITNHASEAMPVSIGYHPYFQLTDSTREAWTISVPARTRWLLSSRKLPTGQTEPTEGFFANGSGLLRDYNLDDVFSDLARDARGRATATLQGRRQRIDISVGPNFKALIVFSPNPANTGRGSQIPPTDPSQPPPPPRPPAPPNPLATPNFICIEPMAGITNALNLAHKGVYRDLQSIPPGGTWRESFWIRPSGF